MVNDVHLRPDIVSNMCLAYPFDIAQPLDNEHQSLLVVAHAAQKEHHLWNQITLLASAVRL